MSVTIAASLTSSDSAIVVGILVAWAISVLMVRRSPQLGAMVTSALGVGASVYLIQQKFSDESICSGDQTSLFDCDAVNQSVYSSLGPVPVATLGAAFFLAVLFVSWRAGGKPEEHPGYPGFLLASGLLACLERKSASLDLRRDTVFVYQDQD